jgi:hypothetical protein
VTSSRTASAARPAALALASLLLAGCSALAPQPPSVDGLHPPPAVQNSTGARIPYRGTISWEQATVPSRSSRDLAVLAFGEEREGGDTCGPALLRVLVRETGSAVHVLVAGYEVPTDPNVQCGGLSGIPSPHVVRLARPLGGRTVIDAATRHIVPVLDGSTVPTLAAALSRWREQPLQRDPKRDLVTRTWTIGSGRMVTTLRLVLGPEQVLGPSPSRDPDAARDEDGRLMGPVLTSGSVAGHRVTVRGRTGNRGYDAYLRALWSRGPGRTAALSIGGTAPLPWTPERLLQAARSLREPTRAD